MNWIWFFKNSFLWRAGILKGIERESWCRGEEVWSMKIANRSWKVEQPLVTPEVTLTSMAPMGLRKRRWWGKGHTCSTHYSPQHQSGLPGAWAAPLLGAHPNQISLAQLALKVHRTLVELFCSKVTLVGVSNSFRMKMPRKLDFYSLTIKSQCNFVHHCTIIHSFICSAF